MSSSSDLPRARALLAAGPARVAALVRDLPDELLHANEGPGTWSPVQVVGHLIHAERVNWIQRLRVALDGGAFVAFDRDAHLALFAATPPAELLEELRARRAANLVELDALALDGEALRRTATHPQLGRVTVAQLLSTWVMHDWAHITQISRTVARNLAGGVGPWRAFFSVLRER